MNFLSEAQVVRHLTPSLALSSQRHAFLSPSETPERSILSGLTKGPSLFKPSAVRLPFGVAVGVKVVSVRPENAGRGEPTVPATVMMLDDETGAVVSVIGEREREDDWGEGLGGGELESLPT